MALAWSLPTGLSTPIPYFYFLYFVILLIHRQRRDDENCHKKSVSFLSGSFGGVLIIICYRYGSDWEKYIEIVKYRIVRYVY